MIKSSNFTDPEIYNPPLSLCPLCGSGISKKYIIQKYNPGFRIDECNDCGFMFMNPRFNDSYINGLYTEKYYNGTGEYTYYDEREAEKYSGYVWNRRIKKIRKYADSGNFLDIGCSFGGFLNAASEYFTPYGIDISEYAGGYSQNRFGDKIHIGTLKDHPFTKEFFSVITMIEYLEHEYDPVFAVNECFDLLKEDSLLLIQTANMDGLQAKILKDKYAMFMPGHLSYFTKQNLTNLLRKTGFRHVKVFHPVEFGLLPKLLKSRPDFKSAKDYLKWLRIVYYHITSKIHFGNFAATSSMVVYAVK